MYSFYDLLKAFGETGVREVKTPSATVIVSSEHNQNPPYLIYIGFCYLWIGFLSPGAKIEIIPSMRLGRTGISFATEEDVEAAGITWLEVNHS